MVKRALCIVYCLSIFMYFCLMFKSSNLSSLMGCCALGICLSVVFGAFGSHALTRVLSPGKLEVFNKANHYLAIQSLGILILLALKSTKKYIISLAAIYILLAGMCLFCLALYLVSFSELEGMQGLRVFGIVAPFGGTGMVLGWALAAAGFFKTKTYE